MVLKNYKELSDKVNQRVSKKFTISVASACDFEVLETVKHVQENDVASSILVGDKMKLEKMASEIELDLGEIAVIDEPDPAKASMKAVKQIKDGRADCLMKGFVNTSDFMKAVLNKESGLRTGRLLSHLACFEIPGFERLIFVTDGGLNINPGLEEKKIIIQNSVDYLESIGYEIPKVAVLTANEKVNSKQPVTIEAAKLKKMSKSGEITGAVVEGPLSFDLSIDKNAVLQKNFSSPVAGNADILIAPTIEVGNIIGKSFIHCAKAIMSGIILGASVPIILTSRTATMEMKVNSVVLAAASGVKEKISTK